MKIKGNRINKIVKKKILSILKIYLKIFLEHVFDIEVEKNETLDLKPPYLILANHSNNWDPLLVNIYVDEPISFVTSDEYFRKKSTKYLLKYVEAIPKSKFISDGNTVRRIIRAKKNNKVIGIFPEGMRNWDGATTEILYPTAKLIKLLKIPVVMVSLKGAHLAYPRWAKNKRKGKISISYNKLLNKENIASIPIEEIYKIISDEFTYDEYDYQAEKMNIYKGKDMSESLELFLFTCPSCQSISTLKSQGNRFYCEECRYQVVYNERGYFEGIRNDIYFDSPIDWNYWQLEFLEELIKNNLNKSEPSIVIKDNNVTVYKRKKDCPFKKINQGDIFLDHKSFCLESETGELKFDFKSIEGLNIQYNNKLEFYYKDMLHRFVFSKPNISAYKWLKGIEISKQMTRTKNI